MSSSSTVAATSSSWPSKPIPPLQMQGLSSSSSSAAWRGKGKGEEGPRNTTNTNTNNNNISINNNSNHGHTARSTGSNMSNDDPLMTTVSTVTNAGGTGRGVGGGGETSAREGGDYCLSSGGTANDVASSSPSHSAMNTARSIGSNSNNATDTTSTSTTVVVTAAYRDTFESAFGSSSTIALSSSQHSKQQHVGSAADAFIGAIGRREQPQRKEVDGKSVDAIGTMPTANGTKAKSGRVNKNSVNAAVINSDFDDFTDDDDMRAVTAAAATSSLEEGRPRGIHAASGEEEHCLSPMVVSGATSAASSLGGSGRGCGGGDTTGESPSKNGSTTHNIDATCSSVPTSVLSTRPNSARSHSNNANGNVSKHSTTPVKATNTARGASSNEAKGTATATRASSSFGRPSAPATGDTTSKNSTSTKSTTSQKTKVSNASGGQQKAFISTTATGSKVDDQQQLASLASLSSLFSTSTASASPFSATVVPNTAATGTAAVTDEDHDDAKKSDTNSNSKGSPVLSISASLTPAEEFELIQKRRCSLAEGRPPTSPTPRNVSSLRKQSLGGLDLDEVVDEGQTISVGAGKKLGYDSAEHPQQQQYQQHEGGESFTSRQVTFGDQSMAASASFSNSTTQNDQRRHPHPFQHRHKNPRSNSNSNSKTDKSRNRTSIVSMNSVDGELSTNYQQHRRSSSPSAAASPSPSPPHYGNSDSFLTLAQVTQREKESRWLCEMIADEEMNAILKGFEMGVRQIISDIEHRGKYTESRAYLRFKEHGAAKRKELEAREAMKAEAERREAERVGKPSIVLSSSVLRSFSMRGSTVLNASHHSAAALSAAAVGSEDEGNSEGALASTLNGTFQYNNHRRDPQTLAEDLYRWNEERQHKIERIAKKKEMEALEQIKAVPSISAVSEKLIEARRKEDPTQYPAVTTTEGWDHRIAEHKRKMEELRKRLEPTFKPTVTPHESHAKRALQHQTVMTNILLSSRSGSIGSTAAAAEQDAAQLHSPNPRAVEGLSGEEGKGNTMLSHNTSTQPFSSFGCAAAASVSPERRLYELHKERLERQAAREMAAAAAFTVNTKRKTEAEIAEHIAEMQARAESIERRKRSNIMKMEKETTVIENNAFKPILSSKTDEYVERYKSKEEQRQAEKEEARRKREAELAAEAARPIMVKTAPERTEEFFYHVERTLQKRAETLEKLHKEREEKFVEDYTFAPAINSVSRKMAEKIAADAVEPMYYETTAAQLWRQQAVEESLEDMYYRREMSDLLQAGGASPHPQSTRFVVRSVGSPSAEAAMFDRRRAYEYAKTIPLPSQATSRSVNVSSVVAHTAGDENGSSPASSGLVFDSPSSHVGSIQKKKHQLVENEKIGGATEVSPALLSSVRKGSARASEVVGMLSGGDGEDGAKSTAANKELATKTAVKKSSTSAAVGVKVAEKKSEKDDRRLFSPLKIPTTSSPSSEKVCNVEHLLSKTNDGDDADMALNRKKRGMKANGGDLGEAPVSDDEVGTPRDPKRRANMPIITEPKATAAAHQFKGHDDVANDRGGGPTPTVSTQPSLPHGSTTNTTVGNVSVSSPTSFSSSPVNVAQQLYQPSTTVPSSATAFTSTSGSANSSAFSSPTLANKTRAAEDLLSRWRQMEADAAKKSATS